MSADNQSNAADLALVGFAGDKKGFVIHPSGGLKESVGKAPLDLVPASFTRAAARAFEFGTTKYARHNWRKGIPVSPLYAALQRHLTDWNDGIENAEDSGLSHLDHAAACLAMIIQTLKDHPHLDDRFKRP